MLKKWIVAVNQGFYPEVQEFDTLEEAEKAYDKAVYSSSYFYEDEADFFLCEVIKKGKKGE